MWLFALRIARFFFSRSFNLIAGDTAEILKRFSSWLSPWIRHCQSCSYEKHLRQSWYLNKTPLCLLSNEWATCEHTIRFKLNMSRMDWWETFEFILSSVIWLQTSVFLISEHRLRLYEMIEDICEITGAFFLRRNIWDAGDSIWSLFNLRVFFFLPCWGKLYCSQVALSC